MRRIREYVKAIFLLASLCAGLILFSNGVAVAQDVRDNEVSIMVTVVPHDERTRSIASKLQPADFEVRENKNRQKVISVTRADKAPPVLAVLIQDDLVSSVNNQLDSIRDSIRALPKDSRVMTGYIRAGTMQVTQSFTTDLNQAAKSLRILASSPSASTFNPYIGVIEALRLFDGQPNDRRRMILLVSDGLDTSSSISWLSSLFSADLDRAIERAQRQNIAVFSIYAPSVGLTSYSRHAANIGQSSLIKLTEETGGEAFATGVGLVTFDPYLREYKEMLGNQWLIKYQSNITGKDFRRIEVLTDFDIHLHHPAGYKPR